MSQMHDEFLGQEDLDLRNLSEEELIAAWNAWLAAAQATNDRDADTYSHGVFVLMREPRLVPTNSGEVRGDVDGVDR